MGSTMGEDDKEGSPKFAQAAPVVGTSVHLTKEG